MLKYQPTGNQQHYQYGKSLDLTGGIDPELAESRYWPKGLPVSERLWVLAAAAIEFSRQPGLHPSEYTSGELSYSVSLHKIASLKNEDQVYRFTHTISLVAEETNGQRLWALTPISLEFTIFEESQRESVYQYMRVLDEKLGLEDVQQYLTMLEILGPREYSKLITRLVNEALVDTWAEITTFVIGHAGGSGHRYIATDGSAFQAYHVTGNEQEPVIRYTLDEQGKLLRPESE